MSSAERIRILAHELRSPVAALEALASRAHDVRPADLARFRELAVAAGRDVERLLTDPELLSLRPETAWLAALIDPFSGPGVTCTAEPVELVCDPTRMRQAVGNLVANGLRHGRAVTVMGTLREDSITIEVHDDGPGVVPGLDAFARGVSADGSSGYGLWLARAIAEAHGGSLILESTPGRPGAMFSLTVPLSPFGRG